ncbi:MAG: hypothetical protein ACK5NG_01940 [Chthoniobacterales bacterium]
MIKEIRKIGNSKGIILDTAILNAMHVDVGDQVNVVVDSGVAVVTPLKPKPAKSFDEALDSVMSDYKETLSRLA